MLLRFPLHNSHKDCINLLGIRKRKTSLRRGRKVSNFKGTWGCSHRPYVIRPLLHFDSFQLRIGTPFRYEGQRYLCLQSDCYCTYLIKLISKLPNDRVLKSPQSIGIWDESRHRYLCMFRSVETLCLCR